MKKKVLIVVTIVIVGIAIMFFMFDPKGDQPSFFGSSNSIENNEFITANPLDLDQIKAISKFRSCEGHDYSGKNIDGEIETNRSMKNYIESIGSLDKSVSQVKVFAPFDGEINSVEVDRDPRGVQVWLSPNIRGNWNFIFFHIDLLSDISEGTEVSAGELIGYANLNKAANFDMALKTFGGFSQKFDSVFDHMEVSVIKQYEDRGLTAENIIITKDVRDAEPCNFGNGSDKKGWIMLW